MTKSLAQWCIEKKQSKILEEVDYTENCNQFSSEFIPNRIPFNSPHVIDWKCEKGHKWQCQVVGRTRFGLKCPICYPDSAFLPVGTKYGCLTITEIIKPGTYTNEYPNILSIIRQRKLDEKGISETHQEYICQCDCGKVHNMTQSQFLEAKHMYCTPDVTESNMKKFGVSNPDNYFCGLAVERWKTRVKRIYATNYNIDFTGRTYESLEVIECVNETDEKFHSYGDKRKKQWCNIIDKLYNCRCYLCGQEFNNVKGSKFCISPPSDHGAHAEDGYWSEIKCDCHHISSFQWIVNKLLVENNVSYRVEYSFSDLYGIYEKNKLAFDFAIFNEDNTIKCLIECQGEQHFEPVEKFGGETAYLNQVKNDNLKREYAQNHNYQLIEISYKNKQYKEVEEILKSYQVI